MEKRWVLKETPTKEEIASLSAAINVSSEIASLLIQRGITTFELAKSFFRPDLTDLHNPFLMKDMDIAVTRLEQAIQENEKILIYGDYDVDGTTSVALVFGFLSDYSRNIDFYIPDRYTEGYGISAKGIDFAADNGFSLIISLDCGVRAITQITRAKEKGIDFIVCDHHNPEILPPAIAILDPKRLDCPYPYKELSGCGVGFKFLQAFCKRRNIEELKLFRHLDLLAVSIASDIVPITGENRILTYWGLRQINKEPRPGIKALSQIAGFKKDLDINNIVFGIGPRINAAGRIEHARAAVYLLLADSEEEALKFAKGIDENNKTRRDLDSSITEEALAMIESEEYPLRSTVLYNETWQKGVIGIVASRCIERYYRPTIIFTKSGDYLTGSARSVADFDLYEAISKCSHLLLQFGGHKFAAGLTIEEEKLPQFRKDFEKTVAELLTESSLSPQIDIDLPISLSDITPKLYRLLKQMGPFGPGNMQPVFLSKNVSAGNSCKLLKEKHLKLLLKTETGQLFEAIGFGMPEHYERIAAGEPFNICYSVDENTFNGITTLQLLIKDIKFIS